MKWFMTALGLGLLATACQGPTSVSPEPEALDIEAAAHETAIADPAPAPASATPIKTGTVQAQPSLRIHTAPGTDTAVIYAAPNGTRLDIFAETAMGDSVWYQVRSNLSQEVGWAYGGNIVIEGGSTPVPPDQPATPSPDQGYRDGYKLGHRDGQNFKQYNSGYNPDGALQAGSGNPDPAYDQAYRKGFYAGFDAGYYGNPYNDNPNAGGGT